MDAVKLTKRDLKEELSNSQMAKPYLNDNSFGKTYGEHRDYLELSDEEHFEVYKYAKSKNLEFVETLCAIGTLSVLKLFTPDKFKHYKSSKFYELIKFERFIIYIGFKGDVSNFIEKNELGLVILLEEEIDYNKLIKRLNQSIANFSPKPYLADNYSFKKIANKVEGFLQ